MWKTLVDFSAQISLFKHILLLSTAQINCSGSDLPLFRKPYLSTFYRFQQLRSTAAEAIFHYSGSPTSETWPAAIP
jgi:hypothetical protein